ncbi:hypothetical protein GVAV_003225 [Gurleya vavrai]
MLIIFFFNLFSLGTCSNIPENLVIREILKSFAQIEKDEKNSVDQNAKKIFLFLQYDKKTNPAEILSFLIDLYSKTSVVNEWSLSKVKRLNETKNYGLTNVCDIIKHIYAFKNSKDESKNSINDSINIFKMKTKTNKLSNELKKINFGHERYDLIFLENSLISEVDFGILQNHLLNFYPFNSFDTNTLFVFVFKFDDLTKTHDFTNKFLTKVEPNYQNFYWSKKNFNKRSKLEKNNKKNCIFYEIKHKSQLNFANNIDSQSNLENNFEFTRKCFPYKIKIPNTTSSVFWVFTYELIFPTLNDNFYPFKKIKNSIGSRIYNLCFKNACNEINFYILEIDSFQEFTNFSMVCTKIKSDIFISDSLESFDACLYLYQKSNKIFYLRDNTVETDRTTNKELFLRNLNNLLLKAKFINYRIPPAFSFIIRSDLMLINPRLLSTYTKQISFLKFFETLELFVQHFNSKKYKKIFSVEFFAVYYDPLMFFCKQQPDSKQNFNHLNYIKCEKFPVETLKKYETFCYKISLTKQNVIYSIYLSLEIKFEDYNSIFDKNKITVFKMIEKNLKKIIANQQKTLSLNMIFFLFVKKSLRIWIRRIYSHLFMTIFI